LLVLIAANHPNLPFQIVAFETQIERLGCNHSCIEYIQSVALIRVAVSVRTPTKQIAVEAINEISRIFFSRAGVALIQSVYETILD
jgi:hypothetical protein